MATTAPPQAGVLSGMNPTVPNTADPLILFTIQVTIIVCFTRLLAWPLRKIRQPTVIAEVLGGIVLGPSVFGRIPNYMNTIFPSASIPYLTLAANLGLVFFMFLIGLELDIRIVRQEAKKSVTVAVAGMAVPFALGVAVSYGLYHLQGGSNTGFGGYLLFLGVAMAITAFPVLARILAELKLLKTNVGAITMAAGLLNDATAWVLLALVVAITTSSTGLVALYVFLCAVAWALVLIFIISPLYKRLCIYTRSFENGPTPLLMAVTLVLVLVSAFVTDIIGVHPIFGGFLAGVIIPHEGALAIKITEKIEDVVNILLLPLYFTLSGLKTQIGLLDTGIVWGYVVLVIVIACLGKVSGCTLAARTLGMTWRESWTVGFLMNCKGLVELIVLNIGHDAGVLSDQVFVIMIVMALVTTCMTTPIVMWLYPVWYQKERAIAIGGRDSHRGEKDDIKGDEENNVRASTSSDTSSWRLMVCLTKLQHVPSLMSLIQILKQRDEPADNSDETLPEHRGALQRDLEVDALRLLELTQRTSVLMMMQESRSTIAADPIVNVFRTFGRLNKITMRASLSFVTSEDFADQVCHHGSRYNADMIILPWNGNTVLEEAVNPLDGYFNPKDRRYYDAQHASFVLGVLNEAHRPVGVLFDPAVGMTDESQMGEDSDRISVADGLQGNGQQVMVAFFGGKDDRKALEFVRRLVHAPGVVVTVLRCVGLQGESMNTVEEERNQDQLAIEELALSLGVHEENFHCSGGSVSELSFLGLGGVSPLRIIKLHSANPVHMAVKAARTFLHGQDLLILGRRDKEPGLTFGETHAPITEVATLPPQGVVESDERQMLDTKAGTEIRKALGPIAKDMLVYGLQASMLVIQQ